MLGPSRVSTAGASDLAEANSIAQEMIFRCGFSRRLGPVAMWEESPSSLGQGGHSIAQVGSALGSIALADIEEVGTPEACRHRHAAALCLLAG